jgi:hypothetical protein
MAITKDFNNFGYIEHKFSENELAPIKLEIEELKNNFNLGTSFNSKLVGNIEKEYALIKSKDYISNLMMPLVLEYEAKYGYLKSLDFLDKDVPIKLHEPWVNFQKKHEFNPAHNHKGVYSFVLWIDIPYSNEEEKQNISSKYSVFNIPGNFQFIYNDALGRTKVLCIPADKTYNNTAILFPAQLTHAVYPFYTSDDYRISVAGNFILQP